MRANVYLTWWTVLAWPTLSSGVFLRGEVTRFTNDDDDKPLKIPVPENGPPRISAAAVSEIMDMHKPKPEKKEDDGSEQIQPEEEEGKEKKVVEEEDKDGRITASEVFNQLSSRPINNNNHHHRDDTTKGKDR